jgi:hypothetical protein
VVERRADFVSLEWSLKMQRTTYSFAVLLFAMAVRSNAEELPRVSDLGRQIDEYNRLISEQRTTEAIAIANAAFEQHRNDPLARLMHHHSWSLRGLRWEPDYPARFRGRDPITITYSVEALMPLSGPDAAEQEDHDILRFAKLIELIRTIAPNSWDDAGGFGSIRPYFSDGHAMLEIRQSQPVHETIAALLEQQRLISQTEITLEVRVIKVSSGLGLFDLDRGHPVVLNNEQLATFWQRNRKRIHDNWSQLASPAKTVMNGETADFELSDSTEFPLRISPLAAGDCWHVQLNVSDSRVPEGAITLGLSMGQSVALDAARLSEPPPQIPLEAAIRDARARQQDRTLLIITPTIEVR